MKKLQPKTIVSILLLTAALCLMTACSNISGTTGSNSTTAATVVTPTTGAQVDPTSTLATTNTSSTANTTKSTAPLLGIRMLDTTHGWALTANQVLKTADGGTTWQDVTPSKASLNSFSRGDFYNSQYAWIVNPPLNPNSNQVYIWYTSDGGQHWNDSMITTQYASGADYPHFLSISNGWLQLFGSPGAGQLPTAIYHTTNGGQSWTQVQVQASGQYSVVRPDGISFKDAENGWIAGDGSAYPSATTLPPVDVTHDGGVTWQTQNLPALPASSTGGLAISTPPVFFGNTGIMPIERVSSSQATLVLYDSYDGGQSWSTTTPLTISISANEAAPALSVYVVDAQHAWATVNNSVYATTNGGQSWSLISHVASIGDMSFSSDTTGWAIGNPASNQNILEKTTDGGKTWQPLNYTIN